MSGKILLCLAVLSLLLSSCSNDLDIIGEWKEVAIVYGLLDPAQPVNYVRVEKAFLGEGNALVMARQHDSIYYGENLSVVLERRVNGQIMSTIVMQRDTTIPKDPGVFTNEKHVLYRTDQAIDANSDYSLVVNNEQSGYTATAHTPIVNDITWLSNNPNVSWTDLNNNPVPVTVSWRSAEDARLYEFSLRFYYGVRKINDLQADTNFITLTLPRVKSKNLSGTENLSVTVQGEQFFSFVATKLSAPHPDTVRVAGRVEFVVTSGGEEFSTYLDILNSGTGLSQSIPSYTNVNNGLGLFSSRTTQYLSRNITPITINKLACDPETKHLKFLMSNQMACPQ